MTRSRRAFGALVPALVALAALAGATAVSASWTGTWRLEPHPKTGLPAIVGGDTLTLVQEGANVSGRARFHIATDRGFGGGFCYSSRRAGTVRATARGRSLTGTISWPAGGGHPRTVAPFRATMRPSGRVFDLRVGVTQGECANLVYTSVQVRRLGARGDG